MEMDGKTMFQQLMACVERHQLPVATESVAEFELKCESLEAMDMLFLLPDMLCELFPEIAITHVDEYESSPEEIYPVLFDSYCELTGGAFEPQNVEFVQVDGVDDVGDEEDEYGEGGGADLELRFTWQGQAQQLLLRGADCNGFYSMSLADELNEFAEAHLAGRWLVVEGLEDCDYTGIYLPAAAYEELGKMVKGWMESLHEA
jgi:hypothetical protein